MDGRLKSKEDRLQDIDTIDIEFYNNGSLFSPSIYLYQWMVRSYNYSFECQV